jgi:hypothetical protein
MKTLSLSILVLAACGTDHAMMGDDTQPPGAVTYWQDVEPIFYTNCQSCHTAGGIGPFAIDDPTTAASYAPKISSEVQSKLMPPWPPGGDTPALRHVRTLTQDQIDVIAAWSAGGAEIGDASNPGPHQEPEVVDIGPTDLAFNIGTDYVPNTALSDDYNCFLAPLNLTAAHMATGFKVTPGNRAIVHHVIIGLYSGDSVAALQALDAETPDRVGWPCTGGLVPENVDAKQVGSLGSWVPGVTAVAFPDGTGNPFPAGSVAVIQMHYNLRGGSDPDRTQVEVAFADDATAATLIPLGGVGLLKHDLSIPANDPSVAFTQSATLQQWRALRGQAPYPSGHGFMMGAGGHMHYIGKHITLTRTTTANVTDTLLDIPAWSFHWQGQYQLVTPIQIDNTDTLTIRCEYDNSDTNRLALGLTPDMDVSWGEGTEDEMCLGSIQMIDHLP